MASSDESHTPAELKKLCKVCASEMPFAAIKCIKCGSYQGFRRYFEFSNSSIALLIALISVIGLAQKNFSDLYRSFFVDPLKADVAVRISSIERGKISILIQNNATSRIVLDDGTLCRVPILATGVEPSDGWTLRYPKPTEVSEVHIIVYENPNEQRVIEGGKSTMALYLLHQTRTEEGRPFDERVDEVRPYCFVSYVDQRGRKDGLFVPIDSFDAYRLQKDLVLKQIERSP
jgi:ribosomal protein L40E